MFDAGTLDSSRRCPPPPAPPQRRRQNGPADRDAGPFLLLLAFPCVSCSPLWQRSLASTDVTESKRPTLTKLLTDNRLARRYPLVGYFPQLDWQGRWRTLLLFPPLSQGVALRRSDFDLA